jgi:hypothetical protein
VTDVLGPSDSDLQFAGVLSGPDATERAILLDRLRIAGDALSLTWGVFFYTVILKQLLINYEGDFWITFSITCTVTNQNLIQTETPLQTGMSAISNDLRFLSSIGPINGINWQAEEQIIMQPRSFILNSQENNNAITVASDIVMTIDQKRAEIDLILGSATMNDSSNTGGQLTEVNANAFIAWQLTISKGIWGRVYRNVLHSST